MGIIATLMLGRFSDDAAAGVGIANQLLSLFILVFNVTSIGGTILIGQKLGSGQLQKANKIAHTVFFMNFWFGVGVSLILVFFGSFFVRAFGVHGDVLHFALTFINICGASLFLESLSLALSAILRSHGFTKEAMVVTICMDAISATVNWLATTGPFDLPVTGVVGVSWGMVLARFFALSALFYFVWKRLAIKFSLNDLRNFHQHYIHDLLNIGIPSAGEGLSYQLAQLMITAIVVFIGTSSLSARVYILNITMFCFLFTAAIAQGTQLLIARYIGGGHTEKAYKRGLKTVGIAVFASFTVSLSIALSGSFILSCFTTSTTILSVGIPVLWMNVLTEPGRAINIVLMGSLKSAGDVRFPVIIGVISMWTLAVGFSYLLSFHFFLGLIGIWAAQGADEWFRGIFALLRWHSRPWERTHSQRFVRKIHS